MEGSRHIYSAIAEGNEEKLAAAIMDELDMHVKAEALVTTVRHQQINCVRTLLREGCDPCLKHAGRTALYWAVRLDDSVMLELLLEDLLLVLEEGICLQPTIKRTSSGSGRADLFRVSELHRLKLQGNVKATSDKADAEVFLDDDDCDVLEKRSLFPEDGAVQKAATEFSELAKVSQISDPCTTSHLSSANTEAKTSKKSHHPQEGKPIKNLSKASSYSPRRSTEEKMKARAQRAINEALFEAASHGSCKCIPILLAAHADPNFYYYHDDEFLSWSTPLLAACFAPVYCRNNFPGESRYTEVVESLVQHGADIGKTNCYGDSALHWACVSGTCNVIHLLLVNGADLNLKNSYGRTPLVSCLEHNGVNTEGVCILLLKWGVKLDVQDKDQWTALHYAVDRKNLAVAKLLLENGAPVNCLVDISLVPSAVRIMIQMTPLDIAITAEHVALVRLLVQWNADVNLRSSYNSYYKSAVELAFETQNFEILEILAFGGAHSRSIIEGLKRVPADVDKEKIEKLQEMITSPFTLKHLVRFQIRAVLTDVMKIQALPIPRVMKDYLCYCDL